MHSIHPRVSEMISRIFACSLSFSSSPSVSVSLSVFAHLYLASEWCKREKIHTEIDCIPFNKQAENVHTTPESGGEKEKAASAQKSSLVGYDENSFLFHAALATSTAEFCRKFLFFWGSRASCSNDRSEANKQKLNNRRKWRSNPSTTTTATTKNKSQLEQKNQNQNQNYRSSDIS